MFLFKTNKQNLELAILVTTYSSNLILPSYEYIYTAPSLLTTDLGEADQFGARDQTHAPLFGLRAPKGIEPGSPSSQLQGVIQLPPRLQW